jgi:hypothetical protein
MSGWQVLAYAFVVFVFVFRALCVAGFVLVALMVLRGLTGWPHVHRLRPH